MFSLKGANAFDQVSHLACIVRLTGVSFFVRYSKDIQGSEDGDLSEVSSQSFVAGFAWAGFTYISQNVSTVVDALFQGRKEAGKFVFQST